MEKRFLLGICQIIVDDDANCGDDVEESYQLSCNFHDI